MQSLDEFIAAEAAKPFAWAENDCTHMCDRWVQLRRGVSPIAAGPIPYTDHASAQMILPRMPMLMNRGMRRAGLAATRNPVKGDVGLAVFAGRIGPAIHVGSQWLTRHEGGFWAAPIDSFWKAWTI